MTELIYCGTMETRVMRFPFTFDRRFHRYVYVTKRRPFLLCLLGNRTTSVLYYAYLEKPTWLTNDFARKQ